MKRKTLYPLIVLALLAAVAAIVALWNPDFPIQVSRERQLVKTGKNIQEAIGAYYDASPGTAQAYPTALQHLLFDPRILGEKKYLDYIPTDPLTHQAEWGEIKNEQGEVIGVHSLASGSPTWLGQLLAPSGSGSDSYSEWKFVHQP